MKKYQVGEDLKQGDECIILDGVVHKIESGYCECNMVGKLRYRQELKTGKCVTCGKVIAITNTPRELPESWEFIHLGVCGNNEHCYSLGAGHEETCVKIKNKTYTIDGCGMCVREKIEELRA